MDYRQRRKEQARRTEQAILQAALALAREHSFDKVSVRDICQRSGITTGAFYHHFRSKEDLLSRWTSTWNRRWPGTGPMRRRSSSGASCPAMPPLLRLWAGSWWPAITSAVWTARTTPPPWTLPATPCAPCWIACTRPRLLLPGQSVEWTADFFFRHFRGVVVDWVLHRGSYPLLPRLEQDYALFQNIFQV